MIPAGAEARINPATTVARKGGSRLRLRRESAEDEIPNQEGSPQTWTNFGVTSIANWPGFLVGRMVAAEAHQTVATGFSLT